MRLLLEQTIRLECPLCGASFERPISDGECLCLDCTTMKKLTKRQRKVLIDYYERASPVGIPKPIYWWLHSGNEHRYGCRLHGLELILCRLNQAGLIEGWDEVRSPAHLEVTELGRRIAKRFLQGT